MVPFIDVGVDWIDSPTGFLIDFVDDSQANPKSEFEMQLDSPHHAATPPVSLHDFLESTPWWVTRRGSNVTWDGQSAFIERMLPSSGEEGVVVRKPSRIRSLKKKDLYAAWNAMMHTPRIVRRRLRRASSRCSTTDKDSSAGALIAGEESVGETVVWRRFMDQISDVSYRADSKRLGDDHLHNLFGEFRHYIVEKYAYNTASRPTGNEPTDVSSICVNFSAECLAFHSHIFAFQYLSGLPVCSLRHCQKIGDKKCRAKSFCPSSCYRFRLSLTAAVVRHSKRDAHFERAYHHRVRWQKRSRIRASSLCC